MADSAHPSRRELLAAGALVAVSAGAGAAVAMARSLHPGAGRPGPPVELTATLAAENALIANLQASIQADPGRRAALAPVLSDHQAHAAALAALLAKYPTQHGSTAAAVPTPRAASAAELAAAEQLAATQAAQRAIGLAGSPAVLLASIAASEASHAGLLG